MVALAQALLESNAVTIPGVRVIDPVLPGIYSIQDALQLSGLSVAMAQVGSPVQVIFTATEVGSGIFGGVLGGTDTLTGLVVNANGIVIAKLSSYPITIGPTGQLGLGGYQAVSLSSLGALNSAAAGQTLTAYVGSHISFDAYAIGDFFSPNLNVMLMADVNVPGTPPPTNPPPITPPPGSGTGSGTGSGSGSGNKPPGQNQAAPPNYSLIIGGGVGAVALIAGVWYATAPRR
jgi:hypothetical protein